MPRDKECRCISGKPDCGSPGKVDAAGWGAIALSIGPGDREDGHDPRRDNGGAKRHNAWYEEPPDEAVPWTHPAKRQREANVKNRERYGDCDLHDFEHRNAAWPLERRGGPSTAHAVSSEWQRLLFSRLTGFLRCLLYDGFGIRQELPERVFLARAGKIALHFNTCCCAVDIYN